LFADIGYLFVCIKDTCLFANIGYLFVGQYRILVCLPI